MPHTTPDAPRDGADLRRQDPTADAEMAQDPPPGVGPPAPSRDDLATIAEARDVTEDRLDSLVRLRHDGRWRINNRELFDAAGIDTGDQVDVDVDTEDDPPALVVGRLPDGEEHSGLGVSTVSDRGSSTRSITIPARYMTQFYGLDGDDYDAEDPLLFDPLVDDGIIMLAPVGPASEVAPALFQDIAADAGAPAALVQECLAHNGLGGSAGAAADGVIAWGDRPASLRRNGDAWELSTDAFGDLGVDVGDTLTVERVGESGPTIRVARPAFAERDADAADAHSATLVARGDNAALQLDTVFVLDVFGLSPENGATEALHLGASMDSSAQSLTLTLLGAETEAAEAAVRRQALWNGLSVEAVEGELGRRRGSEWTEGLFGTGGDEEVDIDHLAGTADADLPISDTAIGTAADTAGIERGVLRRALWAVEAALAMPDGAGVDVDVADNLETVTDYPPLDDSGSGRTLYVLPEGSWRTLVDAALTAAEFDHEDGDGVREALRLAYIHAGQDIVQATRERQYRRFERAGLAVVTARRPNKN